MNNFREIFQKYEAVVFFSRIMPGSVSGRGKGQSFVISVMVSLRSSFSALSLILSLISCGASLRSVASVSRSSRLPEPPEYRTKAERKPTSQLTYATRKGGRRP